MLLSLLATLLWDHYVFAWLLQCTWVGQVESETPDAKAGSQILLERT
jgi:hypothetical protein